MKYVNYKSIIERQQKNAEYSDLPRLKDIIVDLSVKSTPMVERKLRLIGLPIEFIEYSNKKRDPNDRTKTYREDFPDADRNNKVTRIGHEDPNQCPWKSMGYVGARKFAIKCLEEQEDKTWLPKILCKGPSIFGEFANWEMGRVEEDDSTISTFLGGDSAPIVKIKATQDASKLGGVDYKVFVGAKDMKLTEVIIDQWRAIREPTADELNSMRADYNTAREENPTLPEWRDYFEYGYDMRRIFKHTPLTEDTTTQSAQGPSTAHVLSEPASAVAVLEPATETEEVVDDSLEGLNW